MDQNKLVGGLENFLGESLNFYKENPPIISEYAVTPVPEVE